MRAGVEPTPDWQHSLCEVLKFDSLRTLNNDIFCELRQYLRSSEGVGKWQW